MGPSVRNNHSKRQTEEADALWQDAKFLATQSVTTTLPSTSPNEVARLAHHHRLHVQIQALLQKRRRTVPKWYAQAQLYRTQLVDALEGEIPIRLLSSSKSKGSQGTTIVHTIRGIQVVSTPGYPDYTSSEQAAPLPLLMPSTRPVVAAMIPTLHWTLQCPMSHPIFAPNDYKQNRYFEKRNAILQQIGYYLERSASLEWCTTVRQSYWKADARKVCLVLIPHHETSAQSRSRVRIVLHFGMDTWDWIPPLRLVPNRHNLGPQSSESTTNHTLVGSVHYNHSLTEDAMVAVLPCSDEMADTSDARALLTLWCRQRGLWRHDGLDEATLYVMVLYLVRTRRIVPRRTTAWAMVTAWFQLVVSTPWLWDDSSERHVLVMPAHTGQSLVETIASSAVAQLYESTTRDNDPTTQPAATLIDLYRDAVETPVLLDATMRHNYLFRLSPSALRTLVQAATASLQCVYGSTGTTRNTPSQIEPPTCGSTRPFEQLFGTDARFWSRHDAYLRIPWSSVQVVPSSSGGVAHALWGMDRCDVGECNAVARGLIRILREALGDRITNVQVVSPGQSEDDTGGTDSITWPVSQSRPVESPTPYLVVGLNINSSTCFRVVDRGPAAGQDAALARFLALWGPKAQLRRFQDGAMVHAVVWDGVDHAVESAARGAESYVQYQNDDAWQGGIVERIIRHILKLHFLKPNAPLPKFALRDMVSTVDGVAGTATLKHLNPLAAHRAVRKAFDSLADWLQKSSAASRPVPDAPGEFQSALGLPLAIVAVEPLSPALRYAALYPPVPHALLGATAPASGVKRVAGAVMFDPIEVQLRLGASSKWPNDLDAIGAAKTAMLIQLVDAIELWKSRNECEHFGASILVTPCYADIPYMGFVFRVYIRADPELKLLRSIHAPNAKETALLQRYTRTTVVRATHHALVHGVYTSHASSSATVRMAQRWLSTHLLSDQIPLEAVELMVAYIYTDHSSMDTAPGTVVAGFVRWLRLLARFDWAHEPLIVDPQGHLNESDYSACRAQFETTRGDEFRKGPPLYLVSSCNRRAFSADDGDDSEPSKTDTHTSMWSPLFTSQCPERVILSRAVALAERTLGFLQQSLASFDSDTWPGAFYETSESFRSYSALFRVDPAFCCNTDASSSASSTTLLVQRMAPTNGEPQMDMTTTYTRSMTHLSQGIKVLQKKMYRNLRNTDGNTDDANVLLSWNPIASAVRALRAKFGTYAIILYNELCPDVMAIVWRPSLLTPRAFSAVTSEYSQPVVASQWQSDTLVTLNVHDLVHEMKRLTRDLVIDVKVFDAGLMVETRKRPAELMNQSNDEDSDNEVL